MATTVKGEQITTPEFRVSFPAVHTPKSLNDGPLKYSVSMLFPKTTDLSSLEAIVLAAIHGKWGTDQSKWPKGLRNPLRDGAEKQYDGYGEGITFASASSKMKPGLVDRDRQAIILAEEFYGGCYARATITAFAYDVSGNRGVSFGLRNIQKLRDAEPFSGKNKAEDDFDSVAVPSTGAGDETGSAVAGNGLGGLA